MNEQRETIVRATCPDCGDVQLDAASLMVSIGAEAGEASYRFQCPTCRSTVSKPADEKIVVTLVEAGAAVRETRSGPPICHDDLLDFHLLLEQDDWFDRLASTTG